MCSALGDVCFVPIADIVSNNLHKQKDRLAAVSPNPNRMLRQLSKPKAPRPVAKSGRAAGSGTPDGLSWGADLDAGDLLRPLIYHHAAAAYESQFGSDLPARYQTTVSKLTTTLDLVTSVSCFHVAMFIPWSVRDEILEYARDRRKTAVQ
jgi:hypothetical protein